MKPVSSITDSKRLQHNTNYSLLKGDPDKEIQMNLDLQFCPLYNLPIDVFRK